MKTLCIGEIKFLNEIPFERHFDKLIEIWSTQCHTINRRIVAIQGIPPESRGEFNGIIDSCLQNLPNPPRLDQIHLNKLIPRVPKVFAQSIQLHYFQDEFTCIFHTIPLDKELKNPHIDCGYSIQFRPKGADIGDLVFEIEPICTEYQEKWIREHAFPNLVRWLRNLKPQVTSAGTNRLIDSEQYANTYLKLKEDLGRQIVTQWKETTDPQKFVYEDCGIASYLMETWKASRRFPKRFADIGCGNGLLVHLLNQLGVDGIGVDLRKRKIWTDLFAETKLIEGVVDPTLHPDPILSDVDYLIGNHSDELTPWIPIMAARLSCDFFLLPCCPFDFKGKFSRKRPNQSKYDGFLQFVKSVCLELGFETREDRLSIPSTKRKCFVCTIPSSGLNPNLESVIARLTNGCTSPLDFIPREKLEKVQNCSNVPHDVRNAITSRIFSSLLDGCEAQQIGEWREGRSLPIASVFSMLLPEEVTFLRNQHGGLQTFIKNQHQIFRIENGNVRIRDWRRHCEWNGYKKKTKADPSKMRTSDCWMDLYHPDGCPLKETECTYKHQQKGNLS